MPEEPRTVKTKKNRTTYIKGQLFKLGFTYNPTCERFLETDLISLTYPM
jgi:hypothetical protein